MSPLSASSTSAQQLAVSYLESVQNFAPVAERDHTLDNLPPKSIVLLKKMLAA